MKSFYSIIRYVNNPLSKENIAIGMILISGDNVFYKVSKDKVNLAQKINFKNEELLDYTINKVSDFVKNQLQKEVSLFSYENKINYEYLNRLSDYNNGFLQFDPPTILGLKLDKNQFDNFFSKYIELSIKSPKRDVIDRSFQRTIKKIFQEPLSHVIDVDYKIRKENIPNLYFDYTLDGIGVNGSIYSLKSIDLNSEKPIDKLRKNISELESLNHRLDLFSKENDLDYKNNQHYLVINPYKGNKLSYHKLYEVLAEQKSEDYPYSVITTDSLPSVTADIKRSKSIIKFSEFIEFTGIY